MSMRAPEPRPKGMPRPEPTGAFGDSLPKVPPVMRHVPPPDIRAPARDAHVAVCLEHRAGCDQSTRARLVENAAPSSRRVPFWIWLYR